MGGANSKWSEIFGAEWPYIKRLGSCFVDPEEKKAFWDHVKSAKEKNPRWSIYDEFPQEKNAVKRAMQECCDFVRGLRRGENGERKEKEHTSTEENQSLAVCGVRDKGE